MQGIRRRTCTENNYAGIWIIHKPQTRMNNDAPKGVRIFPFLAAIHRHAVMFGYAKTGGKINLNLWYQ